MTIRRAITISVSSLLVLATCGVSLQSSVPRGSGGLTPTTGPASPQPRTVELAALAEEWSSNWLVTGTKSEPTYVETIRISRDGDRFTLDAAANGQRFGRVEMSVDDRGGVAVLACPPGATCDIRPTGYLATVQVLAMARRGERAGTAPVRRYAGRGVACVPADLLWGTPSDAAADGRSSMVLRAVSDPCLDIETGAVLAQHSYDGGAFVGPTLDEGTLIVRNLETGTRQCSADSFPARLGAVRQGDRRHAHIAPRPRRPLSSPA